MSSTEFVYQKKKKRMGATVESVVTIAEFDGGTLKVEASKTFFTPDGGIECSHSAIDLPKDDAIRLRDYLNSAYPVEGITPIKDIYYKEGDK